MPSTLEQAEELIPANVRMISGCQDSQTSADVSNVASFSLPDPAGRAGGACTAAMLKTLYDDEGDRAVDLSFQETLLKMREVLSGGGYSQIPQLSSSRPLDMKTKVSLGWGGVHFNSVGTYVLVRYSSTWCQTAASRAPSAPS